MKKHAFFQQTGSCFREEAAPFVIMGKNVFWVTWVEEGLFTTQEA